ncbi:MAG: hypothetical protein ABH833_00540 [Parcubacteria group bacterium]
MQPETKTCQNCKNQFTIEPDDFGFYEKIGVPAPMFCRLCRLQRRMMWRNERTFYKRICDLCKKNIISTYNEDVPFPVYCQKCWWGDEWDPKSYGRDFDFSRSFFEQYQELLDSTPALSIMNDNEIASVNSEYAYDFAFAKNCYLTAAGWYSEYIFYSYYTCYDKEILDSYMILNSELCYECVDAERDSRCKYCIQCFDCMDCIFSFDLRGCNDCILSVNLRNKSYCILNKQYTKEEYEIKKKEMQFNRRDKVEEYKKQFNELILKYPRKYALILKSVNSTGHVIENSKNAKMCFGVGDIENSKYLMSVDGAKDCYDVGNTGQSELSYESVTPDQANRDIFTIYCWKCTNAYYSNNCHSCQNIFGCSNMKSSQYCILNKQYSKDEYDNMTKRIISHMEETGEYGEFFPADLSPYAYNETQAHEYFPLDKEQAVEEGYRWRDKIKKDYKITIEPKDVPFTISEISENITEEVIGCEHEGKCNEKCTVAFKIHPYEYQFYKKMNVPLPVLCPNCRFYKRIELYRNPPKLWRRKCQCAGQTSGNELYKNTALQHQSHSPDQHCSEEFETSYSPDRKEIVYCEKCYQAEVV